MDNQNGYNGFNGEGENNFNGSNENNNFNTNENANSAANNSNVANDPSSTINTSSNATVGYSNNDKFDSYTSSSANTNTNTNTNANAGSNYGSYSSTATDSNANANTSSNFAGYGYANQSTGSTEGGNTTYGNYTYTGNAEPPKHHLHKKAKVHKEPTYITKKCFVIVLIVAVIFSAGLGVGGSMLASNLLGTSSSKTINTTNVNLAEATGSELSIQEIIARNEDSVVAIETESVSTDSWLGQYVTQGAGSGVIYSEDGYIITNNHVIEDASSITVTLHDGTELDATLVAADSQEDVAVIKVDKTGLTPVTFGDMTSVSVGDLVVAIGNPLGTLSGTATEGIVSALEREITIDGKQMSLIQTSASINPGNSGGGLFDQYGNLIGLVVAKSSGSDVEGLGFAIPSDTVLKVAKSLIENGYVTDRAAAGITVVDLTDASTAMQYGVDLTGVYIKEVTGSNAKKAGLEAGDLIYYVEDTKITSTAVLLKEIQSHEVGDTITFTVVRDGEILKYDVKLQASTGSSSSSSQSSQNSQDSQNSQGNDNSQIFGNGNGSGNSDNSQRIRE